MRAVSKAINDARKIVIKIGSHVLSDDEGNINREAIADIAAQIDHLRSLGKQVVIVSSGAGVCGVGLMHKWSRRGDIHYKQALCAIGQVELMAAYKEKFEKYGIHVGQLLLTREDFSDDNRTLHIRNTLFTLVDEGVIPIINENDSVCVEEIKLGDNDNLSALAANLWDGDVLILLSDIDGLFDKDPKQNKDAKILEEVKDIDKILKEIDVKGKSNFGTGGIASKIEAARKVNKYGIPLVILNGKHNNTILDAMDGKRTGTVFLSNGK